LALIADMVTPSAAHVVEQAWLASAPKMFSMNVPMSLLPQDVGQSVGRTPAAALHSSEQSYS
jgi:hypothetical protein